MWAMSRAHRWGHMGFKEHYYEEGMLWPPPRFYNLTTTGCTILRWVLVLLWSSHFCYSTILFCNGMFTRCHSIMEECNTFWSFTEVNLCWVWGFRLLNNTWTGTLGDNNLFLHFKIDMTVSRARGGMLQLGYQWSPQRTHILKTWSHTLCSVQRSFGNVTLSSGLFAFINILIY